MKPRETLNFLRSFLWAKRRQILGKPRRKEETSTRGRLLQLLPKVEDAELRKDIEETLKAKP